MSTEIDYEVYHVVERKDKDPFWNRIGGAFIFRTKDGRNGITFPNMKLVLLEPRPDDKQQTDELPEGDIAGEA